MRWPFPKKKAANCGGLQLRSCGPWPSSGLGALKDRRGARHAVSRIGAHFRQRSGLSLVPLNMKMGAISMDEQMTLRIFGWVVGTVVGGLFVLGAIALALV
jgi:hypothetical protein